MSQEPTTQSTKPRSNCIATHDVGERLSQIENTLSKIETALVGNLPLGHRGIVTRIASIETEQTAQTLRIEGHDRKLYLWSGIASAAALAATFLKDKLLK